MCARPSENGARNRGVSLARCAHWFALAENRSHVPNWRLAKYVERSLPARPVRHPRVHGELLPSVIWLWNRIHEPQPIRLIWVPDLPSPAIEQFRWRGRLVPEWMGMETFDFRRRNRLHYAYRLTSRQWSAEFFRNTLRLRARAATAPLLRLRR